jgi:8-oxo-dGTP diphosphatase
MNIIKKIGLAVINDHQLLVARKTNTKKFLLPGGKIDNIESDLQCIEREIMEELCCEVETNSLKFIGEFTDVAANEPNTLVTVKLYLGKTSGSMRPAREIEEIKWFDPKVHDVNILADSIKNKILPHLLEQEYL